MSRPALYGPLLKRFCLPLPLPSDWKDWVVVRFPLDRLDPGWSLVLLRYNFHIKMCENVDS